MSGRRVGILLCLALLLEFCLGPVLAQFSEGCFSYELNVTLSEGEQRMLPGCGGMITCSDQYGLQVDRCADAETNACHRQEPPAAPSAPFPLCCPRLTCQQCYSPEHERYFGPGEQWTGPNCVLHHCRVSPSGIVDVVRRTCSRPGPPPAHPDCVLMGQDMVRGEHPLCCAHYRCPDHCLLNGEWSPKELLASANACAAGEAFRPIGIAFRVLKAMDKMMVSELKEELRKRGKDPTGTKSVLIQRLQLALQEEQAMQQEGKTTLQEEQDKSGLEAGEKLPEESLPLGANDVAALDRFALELRTCENAVGSLLRGHELDHPKTLRKLLEKLPFSVQERWRRHVDKIKERSGRFVNFSDLVSFVEVEARVASNSAFGRQMFKKPALSKQREKEVKSPFFTPEAHLRGLSSAASGAVFSCFALVQMLAFPAMGWLAPRLGVTRLYTLGLLVAGVTTVVFGLLTYVEQPAAFLAWSPTVRSAEAIGTAAAQTAARTIIINQFPRRVNSAMSLVEA
ncbi:MFS-type transporter SLC18B1 [Amphibalanus amphitrite]|uniref:MFS-type transporter SLC18B1 n=1 Tax=Amphibalanus amphitrite TaxID=1232801 RepID=A0A6A4W7L4_AMPAM|nr:MFS-type transporter SLC18B1 [Amphibalanus amphitrite]